MGLKHTEYAVACPQCGQDESLVIQMWGWFHVINKDPDGDDDETVIEEAETNDGPYNVDVGARACCWSCDWHGKLVDCESAASSPLS